MFSCELFVVVSYFTSGCDRKLCMSLYKSMVLSCFGFGMKDRPFLRRFVCAVDIISLSLNMTTSWFCLVLGSYKSAKDSHNVSMHDLCLFLL